MTVDRGKITTQLLSPAVSGIVPEAGDARVREDAVPALLTITVL